MFGEYTANWLATIYLAGVIITYLLNAWMVRDDVMVRGRIIMRNVLLWPVFLPMLIYVAIIVRGR